ncbi:MAG: hypothetical protein WAZ27_01285 [Minisyncoccia bacterium]
MTLAAGILFGVSLVGILFLFAVKRYEVRSGVLIGGRFRARADEFALDVKWVIMVVEWYLARTPDFLFALSRFGVRSFALSVARLARTSERHAHQLADFVSHKRNFERRETTSEFLKQVSEHRTENGKDPQ